MSEQKIPDHNNFLEKFAAVEKYLNLENSSDNVLISNSTPLTSKQAPLEVDKGFTSEETKTATCPSCGSKNKDTDAFCANCGKPMKIISSEPAHVKELKCDVCGTQYEPDDGFCMNCGNRLN